MRRFRCESCGRERTMESIQIMRCACPQCGKVMGPLKSQTDPVAEVPCSTEVCAELTLPNCDICHQKQTQMGALHFSAPRKIEGLDGLWCRKVHVCVKCEMDGEAGDEQETSKRNGVLEVGTSAGLTDAECDEFRRLPVPFNDMIRAVYSTGVTKEREHCWNTIDHMIQRGPIEGDGFNPNEQRNGIIMAANAIFPKQRV